MSSIEGQGMLSQSLFSQGLPGEWYRHIRCSLPFLLIACKLEDLTWTVGNTLWISSAQVTGDGDVFTCGDGDGTERAGGNTLSTAKAALTIYLVCPQVVVPADCLGGTYLLADRLSTMVAGYREIDQLGFSCYHPDAGKGGVEDFIVGKGTDQFTHPASGALGRKIPFL
jgi:hypothetical protein